MGNIREVLSRVARKRFMYKESKNKEGANEPLPSGEGGERVGLHIDL